MATNVSGDQIDPKSSYCATTKTYKCLHPLPRLPPELAPLNITDFAFSLLVSSFPPTAIDSTPFLIDAAADDRSLSFSQFLRQVESLSSSLRHSTNFNPAIVRGDVALILSPTSLLVPVLYFSLFSLGAIVSPINQLATESELADIGRLVNPSVVFTVSALAPRVPPHLRTILVDSPEFDSLLTRPSQGPVGSFGSTVAQSDTAVILYSSGTTGRMKGVEITHRAVITSIAGNYHTFEREEGVGLARRRGRVVNLFTVPLFHVYGFYFLIWTATAGETVVLRAGRLDLEAMLAVVERFRVTHLPVSPPIVLAMVKMQLTQGRNLRSLRQVICGGAPLGSQVVARFKAKFPAVHLIQGYGLTEVGGSVTKSIEGVDVDHYGSVGRLTEVLEAKIVDPSTGESMPPGRRGELWLRGPSIMKGYIGNDEATRATVDRDGWLKTGDLCYFDSHGFLFVVDRLKELIKFRAYQVPPAELEHVLLSHAEIADVAVVPYPDEEAGQIPMAFVVRKPGSNLTGDQIMAFVAKRVSPYKKVRRVSFINAIPKSPAGKILRRLLIDQAILAASASL